MTIRIIVTVVLFATAILSLGRYAADNRKASVR